MLKKVGKLFIISGPSGVGKGTLISEFIKMNNDVKLSISVTTRKPRKNEEDGINYFFVSHKEFQESIDNKEFLEYAKYSDNFYGTKKAYVEKKLNEGFNLILEIDIQGAFQIKERVPDSVSIFIYPPSFEELEKRIRGRNTEEEDVIQKRLTFAKNELSNAKKFDYIVVNNNFNCALDELNKIFIKERI